MRRVNEAQELHDAIETLGDFLDGKQPSTEVVKAYYHVANLAQDGRHMKKHAEQLRFERSAYAVALGITAGNVLGGIVAYLLVAGFSSLAVSLGCICLLIMGAPEVAVRVRGWLEGRRQKVASLEVEMQGGNIEQED